MKDFHTTKRVFLNSEDTSDLASASFLAESIDGSFNAKFVVSYGNRQIVLHSNLLNQVLPERSAVLFYNKMKLLVTKLDDFIARARMPYHTKSYGVVIPLGNDEEATSSSINYQEFEGKSALISITDCVNKLVVLEVVNCDSDEHVDEQFSRVIALSNFIHEFLTELEENIL